MTQARLAHAGPGLRARGLVLRNASVAYRSALSSARARADKDGDTISAAALGVTAQLWGAAEVGALHADSGGALGGAPTAAALAWLCSNFWSPLPAATVLSVVGALRGAGGATDTHLWAKGIDCAIQLALEGEVADAGHLLRLVGGAAHDARAAALGDILAGYPVLAVEGAGGGAAAHGQAWSLWKSSIQALRARTPNMSSSSASTSSSSSSYSSMHITLDTLLDAAAGDVNAPQRLPPASGGLLRPFAQWHYSFSVSLLFGTECPPLSKSKLRIAHALREALKGAGIAIAQTTTRGGGAVDDDLENNNDDESALLVGAMVDAIGGAPASVLAPLSHITAGAGRAAAAHLTDLLWAANSLRDAPPLFLPPFAAPSRAALLLAHACSLPISLSRAALNYAAAATPEAALAVAGVDEGAARSALGVPIPLGRLALSAALARADSATLGVGARAAKLAVLTGGARAANDVIAALIARLPAHGESQAICAAAAAARAGSHTAAVVVATKWARRALDVEGEEPDTLGGAVAWAAVLRGSTLAVAATRLGALLASAVDAALAGIKGGEEGGKCHHWPSLSLSSSSSAAFLAHLDAASRAAKHITASPLIARVDGALAAAGAPLIAAETSDLEVSRVLALRRLIKALRGVEGGGGGEMELAAAALERAVARSGGACAAARALRVAAAAGFSHALVNFLNNKNITPAAAATTMRGETAAENEDVIRGNLRVYFRRILDRIVAFEAANVRSLTSLLRGEGGGGGGRVSDVTSSISEGGSQGEALNFQELRSARLMVTDMLAATQ